MFLILHILSQETTNQNQSWLLPLFLHHLPLVGSGALLIRWPLCNLSWICPYSLSLSLSLVLLQASEFPTPGSAGGTSVSASEFFQHQFIPHPVNRVIFINKNPIKTFFLAVGRCPTYSIESKLLNKWLIVPQSPASPTFVCISYLASQMEDHLSTQQTLLPVVAKFFHACSPHACCFLHLGSPFLITWRWIPIPSRGRSTVKVSLKLSLHKAAFPSPQHNCGAPFVFLQMLCLCVSSSLGTW